MYKYELSAPAANGGGWQQLRSAAGNARHLSISVYVGKTGTGPAAEVLPAGWFMGSCAVGGLKDFSGCHSFSTWQEKAEFISALYRALYERGHVLYCLAAYQLKNPAHEALMEIGARQIDEFPNLFHGPHKAAIFRVNIRNAVGYFCNRRGNAYPDEASVNPKDKFPEVTKNESYNIQYFNPEGM